MKKGIITAYKKFLNAEIPYPIADKRGTVRGPSKRAYGDFLYSADREMFMWNLKDDLEKETFKF